MLCSWYQVIHQWYCWWKTCCLCHDLQGFIHPWWCRISSINSIIHSFLELNQGVVLNVEGLLNLDMLSFQTACRSLLQEVWKGKDHLSLKHIYNVLAYICLLPEMVASHIRTFLSSLWWFRNPAHHLTFLNHQQYLPENCCFQHPCTQASGCTSGTLDLHISSSTSLSWSQSNGEVGNFRSLV